MEDHHPAAGWRIRPYDPSDLDGCVDVFLTCFRDFAWRRRAVVRTEPLKKTIAATDVWVAEEPCAGIVGFITLESPKAYVHYLFVEQDWRFCGIGGGLLRAARGHVGQPLELNVDAPNRFARQAYDAMGWSETGARNREDGVLSIRLRSP